jgi:hypothetical protein
MRRERSKTLNIKAGATSVQAARKQLHALFFRKGMAHYES